MVTKKTTPSWSDLKAKLADLDRAGIVSLVQDMYAASKDNQSFLHARFGLGDDVLKPYKATIDRWLWPKPFTNHRHSVVTAKKAIADYKKAIGRPEGLAELMVFYCERAIGYANEGLEDENYFSALVRMFEQALLEIGHLPEAQRQPLRKRLMAVSSLGQDIGYGVGDDMGELLAEFGADG